MKKAVITILRMAGRNSKEASYIFEGNKLKYYNTLPLLINYYRASYEIVPIFTKDAKELNIEILQKSNIKDSFINKIFDEKNLIKDDKNFDKIFKIINDRSGDFDKVIVDVSHGFRHLPIL